jgi:hypothetical protein
MRDISNKTIIALLAFTLVLTVTSTSITVNNLNKIKGGLLITGGAVDTASGISTLTIQQSTSISNNHPTINFGAGNVNGTCNFCQMDSNGIFNATCCVGFNSSNNRGFLIENTGNTNISVNYTCVGSCNGTYFVNGSSSSPGFEIRTTANSVASQAGEQSSADSIAACGSAGVNLTVYSNVSNDGDWLCGNSTDYTLSFDATNDAFVADLNVSIPEDALSGGSQKTATFTFNALTTG